MTNSLFCQVCLEVGRDMLSTIVCMKVFNFLLLEFSTCALRSINLSNTWSLACRGSILGGERCDFLVGIQKFTNNLAQLRDFPKLRGLGHPKQIK